MSKKHYIAIAAILKRAIDEGAPDDRPALRHVGRELAEFFAIDNEDFDGGRFLEAAGI